MGCISSTPAPHVVALSAHPQYPARAAVRNVPWSIPEPGYSPVEFTHQAVLDEWEKKGPEGWADPTEWTAELEKKVAKRMTNALVIDGKVKIVDGRPRNPKGRTGMIGRGLLGRYGPNQAADALVTRFNDKGELEIIAVKRGDTGEWAMPGGFVAKGENPRFAAARELIEESIDKDNTPAVAKTYLRKAFEQAGHAIYVGYVDDPRNTDNSWMETMVFHSHIPDPKIHSALVLKGGDDAVDAKWLKVDDADPDFKNLYANHKRFIRIALEANPSKYRNTLEKFSFP